MTDDLEHTLQDSLAAHASRLGPTPPAAPFGAVLSRLDRRRAKRRHAAMAGSVAIVAVGVAGVVAVANRSGHAPASSPTATTAPGSMLWACTGALGFDAAGRSLFESCEPANAHATSLETPATTALAVDTVYVGEQAYTVVVGDSLYSIGARYAVDPQTLADYNGWPEGINHPLLVGDVIEVPPGYPVPTAVITVPPPDLPTSSTAPTG